MSRISCSLIIGKIVNTQICIRTLTLRPLKLIALLRRTGKEWRRPVLITRSLTHQLNIDWQHSPPDNPQTADPPALATIAANNGSLRTIEVHTFTRQLTKTDCQSLLQLSNNHHLILRHSSLQMRHQHTDSQLDNYIRITITTHTYRSS